jgi:chromosome partitioning protein
VTGVVSFEEFPKKGGLMRTIAIANQKGGCGKTTTAINLSSCLVLRGQKVLLIDCDPQSHATMGLDIHFDHEKSMYNVMTPRQTEHLGIESIVLPVKDNFDIAPSDIRLSAIEQELAGIDGRENRLLQAIEPLKQGDDQAYDYVVIDCPPSLGHLCFNALRACKEAIVPIDMSLFSLRGIAELTDIMILLQNKCDHVIETRALVTMYDYRTRYSRHVLEKVKERFGDRVFKTVIRYNIRLRETVDYGLPVGDYDKHAIGHKDYEKLAEEVMLAGLLRRTFHTHASDGSHAILKKTEDYIRSVSEAPVPEEPTPEPEETFPYPAESSYSAMVEAIATNPDPSFSEDEME